MYSDIHIQPVAVEVLSMTMTVIELLADSIINYFTNLDSNLFDKYYVYIVLGFKTLSFN